jgi:hypothetical protein
MHQFAGDLSRAPDVAITPAYHGKPPLRGLNRDLIVIYEAACAQESGAGADNRYRLAVHELFEALVNIGIYVLLFGLLAWALYFAFGPQVFGLPAIVGVLVVLAGVRVFSNVGLAGLAVVIVGPGVLVMVIGMAMTVGTKRSDRRKDERPVDRL